MFEQLCTEACKGLPERDHENEAWARLGVKQYYFEHFEAEKERHVNESTTAAKQTVEVSDRQDFQKAEKALMAEPDNGEVVFGKKSHKAEAAASAGEEKPEVCIGRELDGSTWLGRHVNESARAPAVARGADTTSWTRPFLDIGEEKLLQPEWLLGLQGIEAGHDLTDEIEGPDLPDEINDKPSVREDLIDRKDFSDKLQAVLSLHIADHYILDFDIWGTFLDFYLNFGQFVFIRNYFKVPQFFFCEAIANVLIREALRYEEFRECLIRLKEEKNGVDPERDGFGLPTVDEESASEGPDSEAPTANASPDSSERRKRYARIPTEDPGHLQASPLTSGEMFWALRKHYDDDWSSMSSSSSWDEWGDDGWSSWNAALTWSEDPWSYDSWWPEDGEDEADANAAQEGDPNASEASAAEAQKMEQLLADGRSWSQAQRATAAMKKDRGFGRAACFICGSTQHLARECPDRLSSHGVSKSKGKGKNRLQYMEDDWHDWIYAMQKGKSKSKGKSYKGKSYDPGTGKGKGKAPVNAYALNHYGLEMALQTQHNGPVEHAMLATKQVATPRKTQIPREIPPGSGMIDSGATCSAGPETSVQRLVTKIMEADAAAQIRVETKDQPPFRFGSGKWGQALYKLTVSSSITGSTRSFSCFALPDPEERHEDWFTMDMLVPVLVGMDWLKEAGAVLDFNDGHCFLPLMNGVVLNLPQNQKGHYMLDVVEYLTDGLRNSKGHAAVHVMLEEPAEKPEVINDHSIEFFPVQFSDVFVSENASVDGKFSSYREQVPHQAFEYMVNRRMKLSSNSSVRLMGNRLPFASTPTTSSPSSHAEGQGQERHAASGRISSDGGKSSRPTASTKPVALQGNSCPKQGDEQQVFYLLKQCLPEELVRAMIEKVVAEERIKTMLMDFEKTMQKNVEKINKAKSAATAAKAKGYASPIQRPRTPTPEKERLMQLAAERAIQPVINVNISSDTELVVYQKPPMLWEMFCSPDSELTNQALKAGLCAYRINLAGGFDLYRKNTYDGLRQLRRRHKAKKFWISTPCTFYCDWTDLNYHNRREVLFERRRREKSMHLKVMDFAEGALLEDETAGLYWEWPRISTCAKSMDGCRYGMKDSHGNIIKKSWQILTTDVVFYTMFRLKVCLQNHEHAQIHGLETTRSAYYPTALCRSIAQLWRRTLIPDRWIKMLSTAPVVMDPFKELCDGDDHQAHLCSGLPDGDLFMEDDENVPDDAVVPAEVQPSEQDQRAWKAKLDRFHRQAGHPTARNMARMMADAQLPKWKVKMALEHVCPYCQEQKGGGISSKQINPASMRNLPGPWEQVGIDVSEWEVPGENIQVKFVIMMDLCTKYKVTDVLFKNKHGTIKNESAEEMIRSVSLRWLSDKPRPRILVPDNAKSLTAKKFVDYMSDLGTEVIYPPDHESWAHGLVERGHQLVKETASRIHASSPDQDPEISLALATAAVNSTEYNRGYSIQWAFGRQAELTDDELRQHLQLPIDRQQDQFARLLTNRQSAEEHARKAKADHVLSRIKNTTVKQPRRNFGLAQPVMVWRKFLPPKFHKEATSAIDPNKWKQLSDIIPKREYVDIEHEQPADGETEEFDLPEHPPDARVGPTGPMPPMRISGKKKPSEPELIDLDDEDFGNMPHGPLREDRRFSTTSSTPMMENKEPYLDSPEDGLPDPVPEPESKRARYDGEDDKEDMYMKHLQIFNQIDSGYLMDIELDLASNRQKKAFQRNPSLYLAKKLAGSEVCFRRLSANEKELFKRAMNSEVSSFIKTEAVRRCLSFEEQQEAKRSGRVLKSRWVLVWKSVPEESRAEALANARENENTVHSSDGTRKAK
ncbi:unnamed protein product, partial [Cladocopium goreaui]